MDTISEEMMMGDSEAIALTNEIRIGALLWVDDVISCVEGSKKQVKVLQRMDQFGKKNKLKWGQEKCKVMQAGKKEKERDKWHLGDLEIEKCKSYKYLGDLITNDGKNKENIILRGNRIQTTVRCINTTASSDVMKRVECKVILKLFETMILPSLLNNSESWLLTETDEKEIEKIEIQALKRLFNLPSSTPTIAIIYSFGTIVTSCRIYQKQFIYLQKILKRNDSHWTKQLLNHLKEIEIGWSKKINEKLSEYKLTDNWKEIREMTLTQWKMKVKKAVFTRSREKMKEQCITIKNGETVEKYKTLYFYEKIKDIESDPKPLEEELSQSKQRARIILIARSRMLECGKNFKGTMKEICETCGVMDDENHTINYCVKWKETNRYECKEKMDFDDIFCVEKVKLDKILEEVGRVWDLEYSHNRMKRKV
jgi:hypothetical protein